MKLTIEQSREDPRKVTVETSGYNAFDLVEMFLGAAVAYGFHRDSILDAFEAELEEARPNKAEDEVDAEDLSAPGLIDELCRKYVGRDVFIRWKNPEDDWPTYRVISVDLKRNYILVKGIDSPDGGKHFGDEFWSPISDIASIKPIETDEH